MRSGLDVTLMHAQFLERRDGLETVEEKMLETLDFLVDLQVLQIGMQRQQQSSG